MVRKVAIVRMIGDCTPSKCSLFIIKKLILISGFTKRKWEVRIDIPSILLVKSQLICERLAPLRPLLCKIYDGLILHSFNLITSFICCLKLSLFLRVKKFRRKCFFVRCNFLATKLLPCGLIRPRNSAWNIRH